MKHTLTQLGNVWDSKRGKFLIKGFCFFIFLFCHTCGLPIIRKRNEPNLARGIQNNQLKKKLPSFGDLHEIIIYIWWLLTFFPQNMVILEFCFAKEPLVQFTLDLFLLPKCEKLPQKKHCSQDVFSFSNMEPLKWISNIEKMFLKGHVTSKLYGFFCH